MSNVKYGCLEKVLQYLELKVFISLIESNVSYDLLNLSNFAHNTKIALSLRKVSLNEKDRNNKIAIYNGVLRY